MSTRRTSEVPTATKVKQSARGLQAKRQQAPKAYKPDATFRKERKVLDAGARVEVKLERLINSGRKGKTPVVCWRRPGVKAPRLSGVTYIPDAAGYVPELVGLVDEKIAEVEGRPTYNVLFEFKSQHTTGSAEKKISTAIKDLAHHCDVAKTVGAVILDTPILTDQQIIAFKVEGRQHSVVVLTAKEVAADMLIPELVRVAKMNMIIAGLRSPR